MNTRNLGAQHSEQRTRNRLPERRSGRRYQGFFEIPLPRVRDSPMTPENLLQGSLASLTAQGVQWTTLIRPYAILADMTPENLLQVSLASLTSCTLDGLD